MLLSVTSVHDNGETVLAVRGELELSSVEILAEPLLEAIALGGRVVLDLSECAFMDSTGLMLLVRAATRADGRMRAEVREGQVLRVLRLTGCDRQFDVRVRAPR
jgi:anti-anti-sigma factor